MVIRPHALCCIKQSIIDAINIDDSLTVDCDRDDCYDCTELYEGKCAANIVLGADTMGTKSCVSDPELGKSISADQIVVFNASMDFIIEVYALQCEGVMCKAASICGWITSILQSSRVIPVSKIDYTGSTPMTTSANDKEFTLVTMRFSTEYKFSPQKPWILSGCLK